MVQTLTQSQTQSEQQSEVQTQIINRALARSHPIDEMPFSRYGSYLVVDLVKEDKRQQLYLRDIRGGDLQSGCQFLIEVYREGKRVPLSQLDCHRTATLLELSLKKEPESRIGFCMPTPETVMIRGQGLQLKLTYAHKRYDNIYPLQDGSYEITSYSKEIKYRLRAEAQCLKVHAPWLKIGSTEIVLTSQGDFLWTLSSYKVVENPAQYLAPTFEEGLGRVQEDFSQWVNSFFKSENLISNKPFKKRQETCIDQVIQILWMNFVAPEGRLKRSAMYMNKHFMTNIWSWDNYFGALALTKAQPDLAWDQLMFFADHQDVSGAYPDYVNDQYASFSCLKPPIAYWAYAQMSRLNPQLTGDPLRMEEFYQTTKKNTGFWLTHRMTTLGLPAYFHGNDSGWDNGTFFNSGVPVVTPDLTAFLIYQCDGLAKLAEELGHLEEAKDWRKEGDKLMEPLIHLLWREDLKRFSAIHVPSNGYITEGDTLQAYLPLLIAYRLPKDIVATMILGLKDPKRFFSEFGLATESKKSKFYAHNGYWRGPIWAPTTYLMIAGLHEAGEIDFAEELRKKWLALVEKSGFFENFDPVSAEGLVDPSFAWTASVYLRLLYPFKS